MNKEIKTLAKLGEKEINELGLGMLDDSILTDKIEYDTSELTQFFLNVYKNCKSKHVWILLGSMDEQMWCPLQVASRTMGTVEDEIKEDFLCMTSFDENRNIKTWNSYFYNSVMSIRYGMDSKCQKYQYIRNKYRYLTIAYIKDESELKEDSNGWISKYQKAECDIALKLEPLLWNPAGKEWTYLKNSKTNSGL